MKIALLGATGFVGAPILSEALLYPELAITAIARDTGKLPASDAITPVSCDIRDVAALAHALRGHDAVIHAFHPGRSIAPDGDIYGETVKGHEAIIGAVKAAGVERLLCVGGAASLRTDEGKEFIDSSRWNPEFDPYKPAILGTRALYYLLKDETDLDWVFLAPSEWLRPGSRTGEFRYGHNDLLVDAQGRSAISLEDYAMAMIEELRHPRHHRERFTIGY